MANLLDTIRRNRSSLAGEPAPLTDETQKVGALLRAKTGRQVGPQDAAVSNLGEQSAVDQANRQLGQLGTGMQIQQQGEDLAAAGQEQQASQARADINQASRFNTVQNQLKTNQLLNDLTRDKGTLDMEKDRARLEQASFLLAMQDKKYTDELQEIGRRRRLDDSAAFQQEMEQMAFGDNLDLLKTKLGNENVLAASDREYKKALSQLSIDDALEIARMEMAAEEKASALEREAAMSGATLAAKAANTQSMYQGLGQIPGIAAQAYDRYSDNSSQQKPNQGTTK